MTSPFGPERMTDNDPKDAAAACLEQPPETTCSRPETYLKLSQESPSLPRRNCPHGVSQPERERVVDACLRPGAERQGHPSRGVVPGPGGLAAQVIEQLAQMIARAHDRNSSTT